MMYLFTREQIESCILRPGQRANPESFVLIISENPPKLVTGDEYNKMLDDEMTTT